MHYLTWVICLSVSNWEQGKSIDSGPILQIPSLYLLLITFYDKLPALKEGQDYMGLTWYRLPPAWNSLQNQSLS